MRTSVLVEIPTCLQITQLHIYFTYDSQLEVFVLCLFVCAHRGSGFFFVVRQPLVSQDLPIIEVSPSHTDTLQSAGLVWMRDQPEAETSTWQHTTSTRNRHPCPGGVRTHGPSKRAAADPCLRSAATGIGPRKQFLKNKVFWDMMACRVIRQNSLRSSGLELEFVFLIYKQTRCDIPADSDFHRQCYENLKLRDIVILSVW
jgi:hypothetical protein